MVFVYHNRKYWRPQLHPEFLRWINEFHIGVAMFFVLSGFLIAYTYADAPAKSGREYTRYMLVRLARILPLYWLILTAYYLDPKFGKLDFSWLTYTLCHGFSDFYNLRGIAQAWSLNVEMTFYFLAPFLCLLQRKHLLWLIGALAALFALTWGAGQLWFRINGNPGHFLYPLKFVIGGTFPGRATEFLAGMLLAGALRSGNTAWLQRIPYKTLTGFAGIFITAYLIGLFQPDIFHHGTDKPGGQLLHMLLLPVFVVLALAGLIWENTWLRRFFSSRVMVLLGNASFAFYLVHISYVNIRLRWLWLGPDRNFVLLWIISVLLYLLFEKPVYNGIRKLLKNKSEAAQTEISSAAEVN